MPYSKIWKFANYMRAEVTQPYILLCEGLQDKVFFEALFQNRGISDFLVECPEDGEEGRGVDSYPAYFNGLKLRTRPNLKGLIITRDADDDAALSFAKTVKGLADKGYKTPAAQLDIVPVTSSPNDFAITVFTIPIGQKDGCLETLLWPAAANIWSHLVPCVDAFYSCLRPTNTSRNTESRIRWRTIFAGAYPKNPHMSLSRIWEQAATTLPLDDSNFDGLIDTIKAFCART